MLPHKNKKATNVNNNIDDDMIRVNHVFTQWIKEITKYGSNKQLIPKSPPYEIYQYSDVMLKHLPKNSLKKYKNYYFSAKKCKL